MLCTLHVQTLWEMQWYKYLRADEEASLSTNSPQLQQVTMALEAEILSSIQSDKSYKRSVMDVVSVLQNKGIYSNRERHKGLLISREATVSHIKSTLVLG